MVKLHELVKSDSNLSFLRLIILTFEDDSRTLTLRYGEELASYGHRRNDEFTALAGPLELVHVVVVLRRGHEAIY